MLVIGYCVLLNRHRGICYLKVSTITSPTEMADHGIRSADFWYQKHLLCQLGHNHLATKSSWKITYQHCSAKKSQNDFPFLSLKCKKSLRPPILGKKSQYDLLIQVTKKQPKHKQANLNRGWRVLTKESACGAVVASDIRGLQFEPGCRSVISLFHWTSFSYFCWYTPDPITKNVWKSSEQRKCKLLISILNFLPFLICLRRKK